MEGRTVSEYALEVVCTRFDKINHRLMIALVLTIILLFASNAMWAYMWMQYDYVDETETEETVMLDGGDGGNASYANHGGSVLNGEGNCHYSNDSTETANQKEQ